MAEKNLLTSKQERQLRLAFAKVMGVKETEVILAQSSSEHYDWDDESAFNWQFIEAYHGEGYENRSGLYGLHVGIDKKDRRMGVTIIGEPVIPERGWPHIKKGDMVHTPRFLTVTIEAVLTSAEASEQGFDEPTHYRDNPDFDIYGKATSPNHMIFAAVAKK